MSSECRKSREPYLFRRPVVGHVENFWRRGKTSQPTITHSLEGTTRRSGWRRPVIPTTGRPRAALQEDTPIRDRPSSKRRDRRRRDVPVVAVLGFVPGITTSYSELSFAGHESEAKLLGLFQVSVLHNIVHGLFGLA